MNQSSKKGTIAWRQFDWVTLSLYISLVVTGWLMIYAVGYDDKVPPSPFDITTNAGRQLIYLGASVFILISMAVIDWRFWRTFAYVVFGAVLLLLVAVLFFGQVKNGARAWFNLGVFGLQPAEFAKFGTSLVVASYLSTFSTNLRNTSSQLTIAGLLLAPITLILLQPDAGSALVFTSFGVVLFRAGMSPALYIIGFTLAALFILGHIYDPVKVIFGLLCIGLLIFSLNQDKKAPWIAGIAALVILAFFISQDLYFNYLLVVAGLLLAVQAWILYRARQTRTVLQIGALLTIGSLFTLATEYIVENVLEPHQQDRINVWLKPELCDPQGSLYNVLQSKLTIASGGLQGKGYLQGTMTKLDYVPEQVTDFIFCTVGEEQGFIGVVGVILLFTLLLLRLVTLAERQRQEFSRYYIYCVAGILFIHVLINVGMTMGLLPIIGIPLPFISFGGSSMMSFTLMVGLVLKLDSDRYA